MVFYEEGTEIGSFEIPKGEVVFKVTYTTLSHELKDVNIVIYDPEPVGEIDVAGNMICTLYLPYNERTILYVRDLNEIITNLKKRELWN